LPKLIELSPEQKQNIQLRAHILAECYEDLEKQAAYRKLCRDGILPGLHPDYPDGITGYAFWFKHFAWIYEPRNPPGMDGLPFLCYPFQSEELDFIHATIERGMGVAGDPTNVLWVKARDMGITWLVITYFLWDFLFNNGSYLMGHRKQEEVDKIGDMATMFEKLRWQLRKQPAWLLPFGWDWRTCSKEMLLVNPTGGELAGESSNSEFGRGDRRKAILFDELPVWEHDTSAWRAAAGSTNVRFGIGTPRGITGKFAKLALGKDDEEVTVRKLYWWMHPIKAEGLEYDQRGQPTSPYYEKKKKALSADELASEYNLDFNESQKGKIFTCFGSGHKRFKLDPIPGIPIIRCWDPGLTFYVLFMQIDAQGRIRVLRELCLENARIRQMAESVQSVSNKYFLGYEFEDCGDPAGSWVSSSGQEDPEYTILARDYGINVEWAFIQQTPTKVRVKNRIVAINRALERYIAGDTPALDGPAIIISEKGCPDLVDAISGGYRWATDNNGNVLEGVIAKIHPYIDAIDCLGYGLLYRESFAFLGKVDEDVEEDREDEKPTKGRWDKRNR
jgi:hypothetical protein